MRHHQSARLEKLRAEFEEKRLTRGPWRHWLASGAPGSDLCVWDIARLAASDKPLDEAERAMIAQSVAPPWRV